MPLVLRRTQAFEGPDYSAYYRHPDGRELYVGRIFRTTTARADGKPVWVWTVEHHHRADRTEPHQGHADSFDDAKLAWRKCWDSSETIHWPPSLRKAD